MIPVWIVVTLSAASVTPVTSGPCIPPGESITATSGHISSPNFPNNYDANRICTWNITVPTGKIIKLTFLNFTLVAGENDDCAGAAANSARVFITNVASHGGKPNDFKICGQKLPHPVYSEGNVIQVRFESLTGLVNKGFNATFQAIDGDSLCPREAIPLSGSGKISSTNYPKSNYTASRNCTWKITAPVDKKIQFEFTDFALSECSASPCSDSCSYVELYDGGSTGSPLLGRFCQGSPRNELQFSTGNQLSVMFHPGQTVARGFEAEFSTETKATNETTTSNESKIRTDSKMATTTSLPKKSLSAGASVGIALGSVAFVLLVFIMVYSCHRHVKKNKRIISPSNEGTEMEENQQRNKSGCAPDT